MPEFILDHGDVVSAKRFASLDSFTQGYIEAMFFTECHSDNPELDGASVSDLAHGTLESIVADCAAFQLANASLLDLAYGVQGKYERSPYDESRAGNDYWYTRNGHGTGFWDRGLERLVMIDGRMVTLGKALSDCASYSALDLYRGDDGLIYLG